MATNTGMVQANGPNNWLANVTATALEPKISMGAKVVQKATLVNTQTIVTSVHDIAMAKGRFLKNVFYLLIIYH